MSDALDPRLIMERLAELRRSFVAEPWTTPASDSRVSGPRSTLSFTQIAQRSLEELRALCELARTLHAVPRPATVPVATQTPRSARDDGVSR